MDVYIKNMVCLRCKVVVQWLLEKHKIDYTKVELGMVTLSETVAVEKITALDKDLKKYDLEILGDRKKILVEQIKLIILNVFHSLTDPLPQKFSEYLSKALYYDYTYLANVFSELENSTIEKYFIVTRVERAKELMVYETLTVTEIAYKLGYSSGSHFGLQFKKVTGYTPAGFKKLCQDPNFIWRQT